MVIPASDLDRMRQMAARFVPVVNYHKAQANAVFQAIEDWEVDGHAARPPGSRAAAIDAAAGVSVPVQMERVFWMVWSEWKQRQLLTEI